MKQHLAIYLLVTIFLIGGITPTFSQSPEQLYQKGLVKEEGEGALNEAIDIYNKIVENQDAEKSLQAKALLHVGQCYEKLGKNEATKAYQRLVKNFPGQKNEVAIARERLNRLILNGPKTAESQEEEILKKPLVNKKIWDETDTDLEGAISPDGRYLSYVDWDTGDLAIYEIATGKKRRLTNKGSWEKSSAYCEYSKWFPDSKKIIYLWFNKESFAELRTINIDNPEPEILIKDKEMEWAEIYDCSSDGKSVLACLNRKTDEGILTLILTEDGSEQVLKSFNTNWAHGAAFSKDTRFVMYDLPQKKDNDNKDIFIMELSTKRENILVGHPGDDRLLGRVPNGNDILFISDRTGTPDFWRTKVENGKTVGESVLIKNNKGPFAPISLGFTNNGAFYYGQRRNNVNIYETEIEPMTGKIITAPARIIQSYLGANGCPDYSHDGKYMAYVSRRPPGTMRFTTNPVGNVLCIRSLDTKEEREFRPNINVFGWPRWSPDGNSVMVVSFDVNGNLGYYQIDTQTGITKPILITNGRNLFGGHGWLLDGKTFFYGLRDSITKEYQVILQNIKSGKEKVMYQSNNHFGISMSPDGEFLSFLSGNEKSLKILPTTGGNSRELFKSEEVKKFEFETRGETMAWSSDAKYLYFAMRDSNDDKSEWELCRVSVANRKIDKLGLKTDSHFTNLNAHPDGKHFTFSSRGKSNSEIWMMENFLPLENLAQKEEEKEPEGIVIKQVWTGTGVDNSGSVSLDGKYLSFVDWDTGDLALRNLNTKQNSSLVPGNWDTPMQYAQYNVISPNGKQIAYSWYNDNASDLYLINIDNPIPKLLYRKEGVEVYPVSWLSDKEIIVNIKKKGADAQIASYSILDRTIEVLKTFEPRKWARLASSPDENYIAYDFANESHDGTFDINILSMDGKGEIALVEHPANDRVLGWIPERNEFLFISDRSGTWDLWAITVDNGKPFGQERRIYTDIGEVVPMGITKNGECFYGFSNRNFNAYILPVNRLTGNPEGNPEIPLAGSIYSKNWSPDGKYMARVQSGEDGFELIIRDVENGNERRLAEELFNVLAPYWSRDRQSVYIFGMDKKRLQTKGYIGGIFTVDLKSNKLKENLLISDYNYTPSKDYAGPISGHVVSDDQQYIYMLFQNDWIVKRNLANGTDTILYRHPGFVRGVLQLSPDGKKLLFAVHDKAKKQSRLITISVNGGDERELCTSQEARISESAFWSPNGKSVYFTERLEGTSLWRVNSEGGTPEKVWHTDKRAESFAMHPSGNEISYSVRERTTEIRVIEGLKQELEKIYRQNE